MILVENFLKILNECKINFFTGVPDSILKDLTNHLDKKRSNKHIIATNEGSAVGLAIGYYLNSKKLAAVYLQNSGLSNALNPLISIAHPNVYSIPLLLIIGWRGAPGFSDEPQHMVQGKITSNLLKLLNIKTCILNNNNNLKSLSKLISYSKKNKRPVACLFKKNSLKSNKIFKMNKKVKSNLRREIVIEKILKKIDKSTKIISTTGYTSRELYHIRKEKNFFSGRDFYMVGAMGHASVVALGVALKNKNMVLCLDGDGSILMHLGALNMNGIAKKKNFKHILLNNASHESVGGQKTHAEKINFKNLVISLGYNNYYCAKNKNEFLQKLSIFLKSPGPSFFEINICNGTLDSLSRPKNLLKIKANFLK